MSKPKTLGEWAVWYAEQGAAVFPMKPNTMSPQIPDWDDKATTDMDQVREWWKRWPKGNIGVHCVKSGFVVLWRCLCHGTRYIHPRPEKVEHIPEFGESHGGRSFVVPPSVVHNIPNMWCGCGACPPRGRER